MGRNDSVSPGFSKPQRRVGFEGVFGIYLDVVGVGSVSKLEELSPFALLHNELIVLVVVVGCRGCQSLGEYLCIFLSDEYLKLMNYVDYFGLKDLAVDHLDFLEIPEPNVVTVDLFGRVVVPVEL